jgi:hypothetical protein
MFLGMSNVGVEFWENIKLPPIYARAPVWLCEQLEENKSCFSLPDENRHALIVIGCSGLSQGIEVGTDDC